MAAPPSRPYIKRLWAKYKMGFMEIVDGVLEALKKRMPWIYVDADMFAEYDGDLYQKAWEGPIVLNNRPVAWLYVGIHPYTGFTKEVYFYILATTVTHDPTQWGTEEVELAILQSPPFSPGTPRSVVLEMFGSIANPAEWAIFAERVAEGLQRVGPKEWSPRG